MNAIVLGRRHQGKSTLALWLARRYHETVIVWDPNAQYRSAPVSSMEDIVSACESGTAGMFTYRPLPESAEDEFQSLSDVLADHQSYALVIDEASTIQRAQALHPGVERIVRQAPQSVSIIQTSHRPGDIHSTCRALATDMWSFAITLPRDLEVMEQAYGDEVSVALPSLENHHCLHWWLDESGDGEKWCIWNDSEAWNCDK